MGLETNNQGKHVMQLYREKYNLNLVGIHTSSHNTEETREKGRIMDKAFMIGWLKEHMENHLLFFPSRPTADVKELQNQINQIVGIKGPTGYVQLNTILGSHDDLFMALLLCCNVARLFLRRQEMLA